MIDVEADLRRRVQMAAACNGKSVAAYVLAALQGQLRIDAGGGAPGNRTMSSANDEVLAELWDNDLDAEYDRNSISESKVPQKSRQP